MSTAIETKPVKVGASKQEVKANIGIRETELAKVSKLLNVLLADEHILYIKTRNAHWNVEGPDFHSSHVFLESQYGEIEEFIDEIAERVRTLGHYAVGTFARYLELTRLAESEAEDTSSLSFYKELLSDHESIAMSIRADLEIIRSTDDDGTEDFLVGLLEKHEKMAWMLRSHLK